MHVTIVVKQGTNAMQVVSTLASLASLAVTGTIAVKLLEKEDQLKETVEKYTKPVQTIKKRFGRK